MVEAGEKRLWSVQLLREQTDMDWLSWDTTCEVLETKGRSVQVGRFESLLRVGMDWMRDMRTEELEKRGWFVQVVNLRVYSLWRD